MCVAFFLEVEIKGKESNICIECKSKQCAVRIYGHVHFEFLSLLFIFEDATHC